MKTPVCIVKILTAAVFTLLCAGASAAADKWTAITWDGSAVPAFNSLCAARGMTPSDVLETNGYTGGELPSNGEELLVPVSKSAVLSTWMEVQSRNGGAKPLVTIKLHGIPAKLQANTTTPELTQTTPVVPAQPKPAPQVSKPAETAAAKIETEPEKPVEPAKLAELKNMTIVISGDEIVLQAPPQTGNALKDGVASEPTFIPATALISSDIIIPAPYVLKPATVRPAAPKTGGKMMWPVDGKITSGFGRRGKRRSHHGIDIPMPNGTPVAAALDGVVIETATSRTRGYRGYGYTVVLDHGDGIVSMYAHCSKFNVKKGQKVKQGDIVAFVGDTGRTTTHHVHFEIRKNGSPVNPMPYLASR